MAVERCAARALAPDPRSHALRGNGESDVTFGTGSAGRIGAKSVSTRTSLQPNRTNRNEATR